jgi:hypothetical protein
MCGSKPWDKADLVQAVLSDLTSNFSQKLGLRFSFSNHYIFHYIYLKIWVLFRLLNREFRMTVWYKQLEKNCSDIQKCWQRNGIRQSPPLLCNCPQAGTTWSLFKSQSHVEETKILWKLWVVNQSVSHSQPLTAGNDPCLSEQKPLPRFEGSCSMALTSRGVLNKEW